MEKLIGSLTIFAKASANIDSLLSKLLAINEKDNGQPILSSRNAKIVKEPININANLGFMIRLGWSDVAVT